MFSVTVVKASDSSEWGLGFDFPVEPLVGTSLIDIVHSQAAQTHVSGRVKIKKNIKMPNVRQSISPL